MPTNPTIAAPPTVAWVPHPRKNPALPRSPRPTTHHADKPHNRRPANRSVGPPPPQKSSVAAIAPTHAPPCRQTPPLPRSPHPRSIDLLGAVGRRGWGWGSNRGLWRPTLRGDWIKGANDSKAEVRMTALGLKVNATGRPAALGCGVPRTPSRYTMGGLIGLRGCLSFAS
jgi:hypothetical protein